MSRRQPDWQLRLQAEVQARATVPWAWGTHDCVQWAGAAVRAVTGRNPLDEIAAYRTAFGALRAMRRAGHADLRSACLSRLGEAISPLLAQPGDVGLVGAAYADGPGSQAFGGALAVWGGGAWLVASQRGLAAVASECIDTAWRATCRQ